jgi:CheY-like chemotaxis protein
MASHDLRHVSADAPRVMVVDGSKLVRKLIGDVLVRELPNVHVVACAGMAEAREALDGAPVDLVTTSLSLPDGDGLALARAVREAGGQRYVPVIVVSGDAQARLEDRSLSEDVTDYFDKSLGHGALAAFIRGYVHPEPVPGARVLYVEDSKVVAVATKRILERHGMQVLHFPDVEGALEHLHASRTEDDVGADLVLTDVYLKGALSGR